MRPIVRTLPVLALSFSISLYANGQVPSQAPGYLSYSWFQPSQVTEANQAEITQIDTELKLPLGASGNPMDGLFVYQVRLHEREFRTDIDDQPGSKQRLYDISVPISFIKARNATSQWIANLSPGVKSSLEYFGTDDLAVTGMGQYRYQGKQHGYGLGIVYTHAFGEGKFVPLANYLYSPSKEIELTLGFPYTRASYAPTPDQHYYLKALPTGGNWHVYDPDDKDVKFDYSQKGVRVGIGTEQALSRQFWLNIEGGVQVSQELEFDNEQGIKETLELEDTTYFTIGLQFRPQ